MLTEEGWMLLLLLFLLWSFGFSCFEIFSGFTRRTWKNDRNVIVMRSSKNWCNERKGNEIRVQRLKHTKANVPKMLVDNEKKERNILAVKEGIEDQLSSHQIIQNSVPQGEVWNVPLFLQAINDITKCVPFPVPNEFLPTITACLSRSQTPIEERAFFNRFWTTFWRALMKFFEYNNKVQNSGHIQLKSPNQIVASHHCRPPQALNSNDLLTPEALRPGEATQKRTSYAPSQRFWHRFNAPASKVPKKMIPRRIRFT